MAEERAARTGEGATSREAWLRRIWRDRDSGNEVLHGFEELYGIKQRDVANYRPLIEFCINLPTDQLVRGGQTRYLARRMAMGRLPEPQRLNHRYGMHNPDWHARMTRALPRVRREIEAIREDPELDAIIDVDRALALIDNWPTENPVELDSFTDLVIGLGGAQIAKKYADHLSGRNR